MVYVLKKDYPLLKPLLTCILLLLGISQTLGQEIIRLKNGQKLEVIILDQNDEWIKYQELNDPNKIAFTIDKNLIYQIAKLDKEENLIIQGTGEYLTFKNRQIKLNGIAFFNDALNVTYEKSLNPFYSWESTFKIVGLNFSDTHVTRGASVDFGYKIRLKRILSENDNYMSKHILEGGYLIPKIGFSYLVNDTRGFSGIITTSQIFNLGIDVGKQWILLEKYSIDVFMGMHYLTGIVRTDSAPGTNIFFTPIRINNGDLIGQDQRAISVGIRFGILFGTS